MKQSKVTIEEIHEYLESNWYDHDSLTDFNMAIDSGFTEYAAYLIQSAGAINSNHCFEDSKPTERAIEKMLKGYSEKKIRADIEACFGDAVVVVHPDTNEHLFLKNGYVDYLVDACKYIADGYELLKRGE